MSERTAVYRFYDADDRLLYVGITNDLAARWRWHEKNSAWWSMQARIEVVWRASREEAEAEETAAIRTDEAMHNIAKRGQTPRITIRVDADLWERFGEWAKDHPGGSSGALRACMRFLLGDEGATLPAPATPHPDGDCGPACASEHEDRLE